jgi:hypothetical protein
VNEFGVAICLLNGGPGEAVGQSRPRGARVGGLALRGRSGSRLSAMDLDAFAPFVIAALAPVNRWWSIGTVSRRHVDPP